jgi:hypothetical protein
MVLGRGRYFNRELTEEAKGLIGDIAPKKIEPAVRQRQRNGH